MVEVGLGMKFDSISFLVPLLFLKPILLEIGYFHAIIKTSNVKEKLWFYQRNGHAM